METIGRILGLWVLMASGLELWGRGFPALAEQPPYSRRLKILVTTYCLHCSSFFWFNQFYIKDPKR